MRSPILAGMVMNVDQVFYPVHSSVDEVFVFGNDGNMSVPAYSFEYSIWDGDPLEPRGSVPVY